MSYDWYSLCEVFWPVTNLTSKQNGGLAIPVVCGRLACWILTCTLTHRTRACIVYMYLCVCVCLSMLCKRMQRMCYG